MKVEATIRTNVTGSPDYEDQEMKFHLDLIWIERKKEDGKIYWYHDDGGVWGLSWADVFEKAKKIWGRIPPLLKMTIYTSNVTELDCPLTLENCPLEFEDEDFVERLLCE